MSIFDRFRRRRAAPLDCAQVAAVLQQFLDGELDADAVPMVRSHLELCERCGLEASIYRDVKEALVRRTEPSPESVRSLREFGARIAHGEVS